MKEIELTQGFKAIVDDEDYDLLNSVSWYFNNRGYVARSMPQRKTVLMHRFIMNAPPDKKVDHENGNKLDNQKHNLRLATSRQNSHNQKVSTNPNKSSKYKGVSKKRRHVNKPWLAQIMHNYNTFHLGYYATEEQAAQAYDQKAIEVHGEFAKLNFPV